MRKNKSGFTLIELLVALGIIGIILSLTVVSLSGVRQSARNAERISDIKQIQAALELYRANEGDYPSSITTGQALTAGSTTYMTIIPSNPGQNDSDVCPVSDFVYTKTGASYTLGFCLTKPSGNFSAGKKCATSGGTLDESCCSGSVSYGGEVYNVVEVDNQCWLARNLNIGAMVSGVTEQTNNSIIEKYCFDDNPGNCDIYGGLYQWDEAMGYVETDGAQGICPNGWHVPTDAEEYTLENYLTDPPNTCDAARLLAWDCANASTKLRAGGTSHFEGLLAGYRRIGGSFYDQESVAYFWSSTISEPNAWSRALWIGSPETVYRNYFDQADGFSVRCLRDF